MEFRWKDALLFSERKGLPIPGDGTMLLVLKSFLMPPQGEGEIYLLGDTWKKSSVVFAPLDLLIFKGVP